MNDQDRAEIERRAYRRYEERGRGDGDDQADWFEAEREARESGVMRSDDDLTGAADEMTGKVGGQRGRG